MFVATSILLQMHGSNGQGSGETIASLTTTVRSLPVIIFSDLDGTDSILAAFDNGAWSHSDRKHDVAIAVKASVRLERARSLYS
jgi:hypothetical protein